MELIKCDTCGGPIELLADGIHGKCTLCGNLYEFKAPKSEYWVEQMNEANELRNTNEFYDAMLKYKQVISHNIDDAQAHWGLLLSTYGIGYEKDYDGKFVPTFHRYKADDILKNKNYLNALKFATDTQRGYYEQQGQVLHDLQNKISEIIALDDNKYDVFISYKDSEINENGDRVKTIDRDIAYNIYSSLTEKNISTFFSEVSLSDCVAAEYEPIIYNALRTAKIFILVADSEEHVYATWVKNEWSRMLEMVQEDAKMGRKACSYFAVCGRHMDESKLPAGSFARTQNILLNKYAGDSYKYDVTASVCKILGIEDGKKKNYDDELSKMKEDFKKTISQMQTGNSPNGESDALIIRAKQCIEEDKSKEAEEYLQKALDKTPQYGQVWWAIFLYNNGIKADKLIPIEGKCLKIGDYKGIIEANEKKVGTVFADRNLKKAIQFQDDKLKAEIDAFIELNNKNLNDNKLYLAMNLFDHICKIMPKNEISDDFSDVYYSVYELAVKLSKDFKKPLRPLFIKFFNAFFEMVRYSALQVNVNNYLEEDIITEYYDIYLKEEDEKNKVALDLHNKNFIESMTLAAMNLVPDNDAEYDDDEQDGMDVGEYQEYLSIIGKYSQNQEQYDNCKKIIAGRLIKNGIMSLDEDYSQTKTLMGLAKDLVPNPEALVNALQDLIELEKENKKKCVKSKINSDALNHMTIVFENLVDFFNEKEIIDFEINGLNAIELDKYNKVKNEFLQFKDKCKTDMYLAAYQKEQSWDKTNEKNNDEYIYLAGILSGKFNVDKAFMPFVTERYELELERLLLLLRVPNLQEARQLVHKTYCGNKLKKAFIYEDFVSAYENAENKNKEIDDFISDVTKSSDRFENKMVELNGNINRSAKNIKVCSAKNTIITMAVFFVLMVAITAVTGVLIKPFNVANVLIPLIAFSLAIVLIAVITTTVRLVSIKVNKKCVSQYYDVMAEIEIFEVNVLEMNRSTIIL